MSNEVILNLSFDNQTVTDLTGNWILDGTPNATYEQIDGRDGYSIVEGSLGRCIVLNAVDQNARYDEYTVDFDMFVKPTYTSNYYFYYVYYLWSRTNPNIVGQFEGKIGEVLSVSPTIGGSERFGATNYSPIGRWVHVTITSGPTGKEDLYHTAIYVDGVKLTERTESGTAHYGNPFGISQRIIPCARDPDSFLMPNGPGVCLNTYKIVTGIHAPNQKPAISLLNLSRVFNNFCTWLKRQLSTVAFTGSYNDLKNKPTISTVNNGTLTIQQNGTTVDTFTANSSTNKTANIQCVDLSTAQTVGGDKEFTGNISFAKNNDSPTASSDTSLALTGTSQYIFFRTKGSSNYKSYNSFLWGGYLSGASPYRFGRIRLYRASAIYGETGDETPDTSFSFIDVALHYKWVSLTDNVKFINDGTTNACAPLANNATDLGTLTNQWNNLYAKNYYYNGVAWGLDKVNEWTDTNTFSKTNSDTIQLKNGKVAIGETISSDAFTQLSFKDKNTDNLAYIRDNYIANGTNSLDFYVRNKYSDGSPSTTGSVVYTYFGLSLDNTGKSYARLRGDFYPYTNNLYSLGTSTNKWSKVYSDDIVHTTGNETIGGVKTFTSNMVIQGSRKVTCNLDNSFIELDGGTTWGKGGSIVLSGQDRGSYTNSVLIVSKSDTNTDILQYQNGELKPHPNNTNTSSLGTSSSKWSKVYSDDVVHTTGDETISGVKTFSNLRTYFGRDISCYSTRKYGKNLNPTANTYQYLNFSGNTVSEGTTNDWSSGYLEQVVDTNGGSRGRWFIQDTSENAMGIELWASGNDKQLRPYQNNTTDLGTATKKWKSFNGVNPGALSLPSTTGMINIASSITALDGVTINKFTPQVDGWLLINGTGAANDGFIYVVQGRIGTMSANNTSMLRCAALIPVVAGVEVSITCKLSTLTWANIVPCQGNV